VPAGESRFSKDDRLKVGDWVLDLAASRLERQGQQIHLEPRLTDLLRHFARNPRRVISKEELIDAAWEGRTLDDAAIARAVAELRKALGDTAQAPRYIETIPKRGYRLVAEVSRGRRRWSRQGAIAAAAVTVTLVLSFLMFRIVTEGDSEALQSPLASRGTSDEQALQAYRLAAGALKRGGRADNESAVVHLNRALELDSDFALARAGLAEAYSIRATWYGADADWADAAMVEASRAVALAPELPEAHRALGFALSANGRFGEAEASYRRALELSPGDEEIAFRLGQVLTYLGEWPDALATFTGLGAAARPRLQCEIGKLLLGLDYLSEGVAWLEAALEARPFGMCANTHLALADIAAGELEAARLRTERLDAAKPGCCDQILGEIAYRQGRLGDAASHFERALEWAVEPKSTVMRIRLAQIEGDSAGLGAIAASAERQLTAGVDVYFSAWLLAMISAALDDKEGALRWHDEATARGFLDWRSTLADPTFESLRGTPELESMVSGMQTRIAEMRKEIESLGLMEKVRLQAARHDATEP
jgi:DNA-binding winged helix-turn-helix (wHTH) protein/tetratricopeptide (TPR) repeat protein